MKKKHPRRARKRHLFGRGTMFVLCLVFSLLFLLMKLITVGAAKLCKWLWTGVKSLFVGKKGK